MLNTTNYIAFTNHADAVPINDTDRRWSPIFTPWDEKAALEARIGTTVDRYFGKLASAIECHAPALAHWLRNLAITDDFDPNGHAPETPEKSVMRHQGEDDDVQIVREALESGLPGIGATVLATSCLSEALEPLPGAPLVKPERVAVILKRLGWMKHPEVVWWRGKSRRIRFTGRMPKDKQAVKTLLDATAQV